MKHPLLIVLILIGIKANAQTINGKVVDKGTGLPLKYIFVASSSGTAFTNDDGVFSVKINKPFDTVRISTMGYQKFIAPVTGWGTFIKKIELLPQAIQLNEVWITAKKNYHKDSVALRQDFAKQFNYTGPKINDLLQPPTQNVPFAFATLNVGALISLITKKSNPDYKLKQVLLKDERENHVSARFNRTLVAGITHLAGDSLENFMSSFRPSPAVLDKLTDYDLIGYVKTNLDNFRVKGVRLDSLPKLLRPGQSLE